MPDAVSVDAARRGVVMWCRHDNTYATGEPTRDLAWSSRTDLTAAIAAALSSISPALKLRLRRHSPLPRGDALGSSSGNESNAPAPHSPQRHWEPLAARLSTSCVITGRPREVFCRVTVVAPGFDAGGMPMRSANSCSSTERRLGSSGFSSSSFLGCIVEKRSDCRCIGSGSLLRRGRPVVVGAGGSITPLAIAS